MALRTALGGMKQAQSAVQHAVSQHTPATLWPACNGSHRPQSVSGCRAAGDGARRSACITVGLRVPVLGRQLRLAPTGRVSPAKLMS
jgi:hypothetical protein